MHILEDITGKGLHWKATDEWTEMEILTGPFLVLTFRGFSPVVRVRILKTQEEKLLFVSGKSFSTGVIPLLQKHRGRFTGLRLRIRRDGNGKFSRWLVEEL